MVQIWRMTCACHLIVLCQRTKLSAQSPGRRETTDDNKKLAIVNGVVKVSTTNQFAGFVPLTCHCIQSANCLIGLGATVPAKDVEAAVDMNDRHLRNVTVDKGIRIQTCPCVAMNVEQLGMIVIGRVRSHSENGLLSVVIIIKLVGTYCHSPLFESIYARSDSISFRRTCHSTVMTLPDIFSNRWFCH